MEPYERIINYRLVTDWFGRWPAFHDAEVLSMALDRGPLETAAGPSLTVRLHAFQPTPETEDRGYFRVIKHAIITLEFAGMEEVTLEGFNCQNVIFQLDLAEAANDEGPSALDVCIHSSFGVGCGFRSTFARVKSVEPGKPDDGIYA
jgi:hypothetical protein